MTEKNEDRVADTDSAQVAKQQQGASDWPVPGDEGYVHPDGTPGSVEQLERNRRAAADRAAAGSAVHGAPAATPGPQLAEEAAAAVARAEAKSPVTMAEAEEGLTEFVEKGHERAADKAEDAEPTAPKVDPQKRTATTDGGKTTR
jgi:hypothetical protein